MNNVDTFANEFNRGNGAYPVDEFGLEETEEEREEYSRELFKREIRRLMHQAVKKEYHETLYGLMQAYEAMKILDRQAEDQQDDLTDGERLMLAADRNLRL